MYWSVLVVVLIVAATVVVVAFMVDLRSASDRKRILASPVDRPELAGEDAPDYIQPDNVPIQNQRTPSPEDREALMKRLSELDPIAAGYASPDFATDSVAKLAVLEAPAVLLAESVDHMADLWAFIQAVRDTGFVVVARDIGGEVIATLSVNAKSGRLSCVCVQTDDVDVVATAVGGTVLAGSDITAGYIPDTALGHCTLWVSDPTRTWIVTDTV